MKSGSLWKIIVGGIVLLAAVGVIQMKVSRSEIAAAPSAPAVAESSPASPAPAAVQPGAVCPVQPDPAAPAACVAPPPAPEKAVPAAASKPAAKASPSPAKPTAEAATSLPRMLDLGSTTCIPCKMMVPVMDALKQEYAGKLTVEFINVNEDSAAAEKYRIQSIPTQILFDKTGKEIFRHIGFWPKEEIVAKCKQLGLLS